MISHLQLGIGIGMEEQDHSGSLWRWEPQAGNAAAIGLRTSAKKTPGCICCLLMELQHEKPLVAPIVMVGRLVDAMVPLFECQLRSWVFSNRPEVVNSCRNHPPCVKACNKCGESRISTVVDPSKRFQK